MQFEAEAVSNAAMFRETTVAHQDAQDAHDPNETPENAFEEEALQWCLASCELFPPR